MRVLSSMYVHKSASIVVTFINKDAALSDFYAERPRKGHGSQLLKGVTKHCDELGVKRLVLEVKSGNPKYGNKKLIKFYERFGFVRVGSGKSIIMVRDRKK